MSILSKLFGQQSPESQKNIKFQEIEKQYDGDYDGDQEDYDGDQEMINFTKAAWLTSRGNHYGQQGKFDQAIIDLKEAIEFKPDHIPAHLSLGIAYREKRMLHEALATLNKAPHKTIMFGNEIGGDEFDLYNAITSVYLLMGDNSKTISYAKKAIEAVNDPKRKEQLEIAKRAGVISEREDDDSQMIEMLKRLIHELEGK